MQSSSLDILSDLLLRYIAEIGRSAHTYADSASRACPNADDVVRLWAPTCHACHGSACNELTRIEFSCLFGSSSTCTNCPQYVGRLPPTSIVGIVVSVFTVACRHGVQHPCHFSVDTSAASSHSIHHDNVVWSIRATSTFMPVGSHQEEGDSIYALTVSLLTQLKGLSDMGVRLEDISAYTSVQV